MKQYTSTDIPGATSIKQILDNEFIERFQQIALGLLRNYTGEGSGRYDSPISREEVSVLKGEVTLKAKIRFLEESLEGQLYLIDKGFETLNADSSQNYSVKITPDFGFSLYASGNMYNVLASRIVKNYRTVLTALENAIRKRRINPTRYIPTNVDTLTKFSSEDLRTSPLCNKVIKINETLKEWGYQIDDQLERLHLEDKFGEWSFSLNPLNGRIKDHSAEMLGNIYLRNLAGSAALDRLETECLRIEKIVTEVLEVKENNVIVKSH